MCSLTAVISTSSSHLISDEWLMLHKNKVCILVFATTGSAAVGHIDYTSTQPLQFEVVSKDLVLSTFHCICATGLSETAFSVSFDLSRTTEALCVKVFERMKERAQLSYNFTSCCFRYCIFMSCKFTSCSLRPC